MRIMIKVGTTVLTQENGQLDYNFIHMLSRDIAKLCKKHQVLLVTSGAVGAGRAVIKADLSIKSKPLLAGIGQIRLMQIYAEFFAEHQITISQSLLKRSDFEDRLSSISIRNVLDSLLAKKILPIINENDISSSSTFGDNDQLAAITAVFTGCQRFIILSDVDGLYDLDPKQSNNAKIVKQINSFTEKHWNYCQNINSGVGSGGMASKLKAAELASNHGITTVIVKGKKSDSLFDALSDNNSGTTIKLSKPAKPSLRNTWMKDLAQHQGVLTVDDGASVALSKNRSLLAVGVVDISGEFKDGDVLIVEDHTNKKPIAVGRAEMDHKTMRSVMKKQQKKGQIFIHKNNLFLY